MLDEIELKSVHKDKKNDRYRKMKYDTEENKASQKQVRIRRIFWYPYYQAAHCNQKTPIHESLR